MPSTTTIVTAPGKVLITGGFLVLDRAYNGLVIGTDARFQTTIHAPGEPWKVSVASPQFGWNQTYRILYNIEDGQVGLEQQSSESGANPYVETTLKNVLAFALAANSSVQTMIEAGFHIEILGANDFYSQREEIERRKWVLSYESLKNLPAFVVSPNASLKTVKKTGLGSSAALITSLTGALLVHLGISLFKDETLKEQELALVHNIAQFCHCLAQGKIGSGFDVSSAVYGSHRYRRFSPSLIEELLQMGEGNLSVPGVKLVKDLQNQRWDSEVKPFHLPPGITLALGDVAVGSSTPSMVTKVNAWRAADKENADRVWKALSQANDRVDQLLRTLTDLYTKDHESYNKDLSTFSTQPFDELKDQTTLPSALQVMCDIHITFQIVRGCLREMGERSGVPIEPVEQTRLVDAISAIPGVLAAGVPGAGGYDAVFVLVTSPSTLEAVLKLWSSWTEMSVCPLLASESAVGLVVNTIN